MHKHYPYLQDSYVFKSDIEREKRNILKEIDSFLNQRQYVKITLLDWNEEPIKEIEGEISSGSMSKTADSPIRRTVQLTCAVDARSYSVDDGKADFAINKKVFIEIGVKNETPHYSDYPIFWFPEGVFFIGSFAINASSGSSTTITLGLKDKMAMLNGDVGGTLPTTVRFDAMDTQLPTGEYIEQKVLIYNIIKEAVNHYGGEDLNRIVIEGVPLRIRRIMQWTGDEPLYLIKNVENSSGDTGLYYEFTKTQPTDITDYETFNKGADVGYIMDDFVVTNDLTCAPGESVVSLLDKIKSIIGNYEYFYDVFGVFHFREIKNYYVTTQARTLLDEMAENDYLVETNNNKSIYTFDDEKLLTSISVTPQYENIKNDYIIEGRTSMGDSNIACPIRYHLVIDDKPRSLGTDDRSTVRQMIDNTDLIEEQTIALNQLLAGRKNSGQTLEDILYKIRAHKNNIVSDKANIDTKDKELLKYLQDFHKTNFTYKDLTQPNKLLSEVWLEKTLNRTDLDTYLQTLKQSDNDITNELKQLEKNKEALDKYLENMSKFNSIFYQTTNVLDIYTSFLNINNAMNVANRYGKTEISQLESKIKNLQEQQTMITNSFNSFKQCCIELCAFIRQLQNDIKDKRNIILGSNESGAVPEWQANDYDSIINTTNSNEVSFSHNIEKFTEKKTNNNIYKIKLENGAIIQKDLSSNNEEFYNDGLLNSFFKLWQRYHLKEDTTELGQIINLQNSIDELTKKHGTFDNKAINTHRGANYYGVYPAEIGNTFQELVLYKHPRDSVNCAAYAAVVSKLPDVGNFNLIYKIENSDSSQKGEYYYWDGQIYQTVDILAVYDNSSVENAYYAYDWRTKLYLDGLKGVINGTDKGYYFAELSAFWPQVYNLVEQEFFSEDMSNTNSIAAGTYYLDFLDSTSTSFGEWSVNNIGRRSDVIVKEEINCLFQPEIPNVVILPINALDLSVADHSSSDTIYSYNNRALESPMTLEELRTEAKTNFYPWTQVDSSIYSQLFTGGYKNGAFDQIKYELYLHTRYQKSVSLTSIPVFYLEPNNRITINDTTTNTYGDFVIQSINLTLGPGANMSITCSEIAERF